MENQVEKKSEEMIIKDSVQGLAEKMGIPSEIDIDKPEDGEEEGVGFMVNIKTTESNYLIGQYGVNLQALQHLARIIVRKKFDIKTNFTLDVNFYRKEKNQSISILAKNMAEQAVLEKRAVVLRPMSPYERRLVHMELAKNDQIKTESIGEGENRRVVIKPADLI